MKTPGPPRLRNTKTGFIVSHREFIQDIVATQAFVNQVPTGSTTPGFILNPGNQLTFPWLAQIAENFEEWKPRGILFEFKTTSSDAVVSTNANAALGTVIMATEYNAYNGTFANKQQMENYEFAVACKPSCSFTHQVECSTAENPEHIFYVRTGAVPTGADQRLYDLGTFQIATVGMQSNGNSIGELWVTYEIEFKKPRIAVGSIDNTSGVMDYFEESATITAANPFGTGTSVIFPQTASNLRGIITPTSIANVIPTLDGNNNPTGSYTASAADTYYFPPGISIGNYLMVYQAGAFTSGSVTTLNLTATTNCIPHNTLQNYISIGTSLDTVQITIPITIIKANASVTFTFSGTATNGNAFELYVIQFPDSFV